MKAERLENYSVFIRIKVKSFNEKLALGLRRQNIVQIEHDSIAVSYVNFSFCVTTAIQNNVT